jgi:hypothetical protein
VINTTVHSVATQTIDVGYFTIGDGHGFIQFYIDWMHTFAPRMFKTLRMMALVTGCAQLPNILIVDNQQSTLTLSAMDPVTALAI